MRAEHGTDRLRFGHVVEHRARSVSIDIINRILGYPGVNQCRANCSSASLGIGRDNVVGVCRHAKTKQLRVNTGVAGHRPIQRFQHQDRSPFAKDKAGTGAGKWAAGIRTQNAKRLPTLERADGEASFRPARKRYGGPSGSDHVQGDADGVSTRGTSARNRERRSLQAEIHTDLAGAGVDHEARNCKGMESRRIFTIETIVAVIESVLPADAGSDDRCRCLRELLTESQVGIGDRTSCGNNGELCEPVEKRDRPDC